jgi:beta-glucanase (GH16 family)
MKRLLLALAAATLFVGCRHRPAAEWELVWEDDFEEAIDSASWSKIPRWHPEWAQKMSEDPRCYDLRDGNLVLRAIANDDPTDSVGFITGGLYTKHKRAFHGGRLEIRARLHGAHGAWPAIWLKPFEEERFPWPTGGEIDIMEHLNHDSIVYQTVHSHYTHTLGRGDVPPHGTTAPIRPDDYNVYGVELGADSLVFSVNGRRTFAYPRIETDAEGQYPFDKPYYLLVDMQLGGTWVGAIDPDEVPVEMEIDWVRYYRRK